MELEDFKSAYQKSGQVNKDIKELRNLFGQSQRNVLDRIKGQLLIETILWTAFLLLFYDGFDAAKKPIIWTLSMVVGILLLISHNIFGIRLGNRPVHGDSLQDSLQNYLRKIRRFAKVSVALRILVILLVFVFFMPSVKEVEEKRMMILLGMSGLLIIQVFFLNRMWKSRIHTLRQRLNELS
ncbi:MAG: hypothetical protein AAFY71_04345 [Bacteroidota bacterium]